jgi:DNA-binding CsgD family transcriptional regulator
MSGFAALAAGDVEGAGKANEAAWQVINPNLPLNKINSWRRAATELAAGELGTARRWADEAVAATAGWHLMVALTTRARVAIAEGESERGERDAHAALAIAADIGAQLGAPDIFEILASLAADTGGHSQAARLFGAAEGIRQRTGEVRFAIYEEGYQSSVTVARDAMGETDFETARAEGAALSTDEAIAYTQRGRGERRRASTGWTSLTPAELDVVRLVSDGLANKDIASRLFISPRTVESHLSHVYTKLGITSRVQLVQEVARHA